MKVLIVVDKAGTAIDRLAHAVARNNRHLDIKILPVHPKRNDVETIYEASNLLEWCDIIDIHYWKSGEVLRQQFPSPFEKKPKILFHMNPYDAENEVNKLYDLVVVGNEEIHNRVPYANLVPYGIDLSFFTFKEDYEREKIIQMSVARIEGKKGVLEVAKACKEIGYRLLLIGRVSSGEYVNEVLKTGVVDFYENATEEQLRDSYYKAAIHICNSQDGFESGTLPILEAMACGTPVLTRNIGHVPELSDGGRNGNMVIRKGEQEDIKDLVKNLKEMIENIPWLLKMREKAWDTVRTRDDRIMARKIAKFYYSLYKPDEPLVSVIMPTKDNPEAFTKSFLAALAQDYPKYEIVVADSGDASVKPIIESARRETSIPIKYIKFDHNNNYTLAEARNRAIVEAEGKILVFCDDRIAMEKNAVTWFANSVTPGSWIWGVKDNFPKGFVENFSSIYREDLIKRGMFNERMQWYGGMTQEIRSRFENTGIEFIIINDAKAKGIKRSKSKKSRRANIIEAKFLINKLYG